MLLDWTIEFEFEFKFKFVCVSEWERVRDRGGVEIYMNQMVSLELFGASYLYGSQLKKNDHVKSTRLTEAWLNN